MDLPDSRLLDDAQRGWRELGRDEYDIFPLADYLPSQPGPRSTSASTSSWPGSGLPALLHRGGPIDRELMWEMILGF